MTMCEVLQFRNAEGAHEVFGKTHNCVRPHPARNVRWVRPRLRESSHLSEEAHVLAGRLGWAARKLAVARSVFEM